MSDSFATVDTVLKTIAQTAIDNEQYFCELDSVVGDGDFGFSLARGFEKVLEDYDSFDRKDIGTFLKKVGMVITSRCGGTSGPIWGTGFMRAGMSVGDKTSLDPEDVVTMLRASFEGIQARGKAELGDKTLLDALGPFTDSFAAGIAQGDSLAALVQAATDTQQAAEATSELIAKRGRAAYTGERSIGSPDAGAMAVALLINKVTETLNQ
ncbi:dihydroxyacetone kinase subunit DhaL [Gammaproteobacteria bacterium]|nr:dihydroxyacetone kinase subunit DhaL [Gammaproteobacteria bacterium]